MINFSYLKVLFSPFRPFKVKFYAGPLAIGVPYFYPRKWIRSKEKPTYKTAIPKKIGFDFVNLGWKLKWDDNDFRFEYAPLISFVFFKWQIVATIKAPNEFAYWESWLYYEHRTDKSLSNRDRIKQTIKEFPLIYITSNGKERKTVNYYEKILKDKYKNEIH